MSEKTLTFGISGDLAERLAALAERDGKPVEETAAQAMREFVETWEDYHATCDALSSGEDDRVALHVVNE